MSAEPGQVVSVLAQCPSATSEAAMAQTLAGTKQLDESLRMAGWKLFEAVTALSDHRRTAALGIKARIAEVLAADEHVIALKPALDEQEAKALQLLTDVPKPTEPKPTEPKPETVVVRAHEAVNLDPGQARTLLDAIRTEMEQDRELRLSVSWRLLKTTGKT